MPLALDVLLPLPLPALTYLPPLTGAEVRPGQRVVVPWQGGVRVGLVTDTRMVDAGRGLELRHVLHAFGADGWLDQAALQALQRMARAAGVPTGTVLSTLNPPGLQPDLVHEVSLSAAAVAVLAEQAAEGAALPPDTWLPAQSVPARQLEFLRQQGLVDERGVEQPRTVRMLVPKAEPDEGLQGQRRAPQLKALQLLLELGSIESGAQLARDADVSPSSVRSLVTRGYADYQQLPAPEPPLPAPPLTDERLPDLAAGPGAGPPVAPNTGPGPDLNSAPGPGPDSASGPDLNSALGGQVSALVGGTRLQRLGALLPALRAEVAQGRSVLVLAPEQTHAAQAAALLGNELPTAYLTGEATDEQRVRLWSELPTSGPQVLVGTYLALLAPLPELGRVVVLDSGSSAYKLQSGARLLLSKAARLLADSAGARLTLVDLALGPDLVAGVPAGGALRLPLPRMRLHVADLNDSGNWPVHPDLQRTLRQVADRQRQAVILAPRRGFSGAFGCQECGWQAPCPNCDLTLRYHRQERRLLCHQCGHEERPANTCPDCGGTALDALRGAGTQWVASQLASSFEGVRVYRYDSDQRDDLTQLYAGAPGVVVGTLAVLGLRPLPQLSLVGVTHFDTHLAAADFRAEEEATRTLLRLVELSGARRPLVVVQTHSPEHELLVALGSAQPEAALEALMGQQLERRKRFGYPPFSILAKLQFTARDRGSALAAAQRGADALVTAGASESEILGPASAPVERLRGRYVFNVLLKAADDARLETLLAALPRTYSGAKLVVDVDPQEVGALLD